jgi:hypothetical protein
MSSMSFRLLTAIGLVAVCGVAAPAAAAPGLGQAGYSLAKVSASVPASEISQLAFRPGDTAPCTPRGRRASSPGTTTTRSPGG